MLVANDFLQSVVVYRALSKFNHPPKCTGYEKMKNNLGFADSALPSSQELNRSLKLTDKATNVPD
jgi:hypothetical protein